MTYSITCKGCGEVVTVEVARGVVDSFTINFPLDIVKANSSQEEFSDEAYATLSAGKCEDCRGQP